MKNADWMQKAGYSFNNIQVYKNYSNDKSWDYGIKIYKNSMKIHVKGSDPVDALTRWLDEEYIEPILDDKERKYLSDVIRPFRDRIVFVTKVYHCGGNEQIIIGIKSAVNSGAVTGIEFPYFKEGSMYKGMKCGTDYTIAELML